MATSEMLAFLHGDEYAELFFQLKNRWPSHVPTKGEWPYERRMWVSYFPRYRDDSRRQSKEEG